MSGSRCPLVVIGDALLDRDVEGRVERLSPEAPVPVVDEVAENARPGGAGLAAALAAAEAIARSERAILDAVRDGRALHDLTTYAEHVARLDAGEDSALAFRVEAGTR